MELQNKKIYLDTCSYRKIAKTFLNGEFSGKSLIEIMQHVRLFVDQMKACEKLRGITVYFNALVIKELSKYLNDDKSSEYYKECYLALQILNIHAERINCKYLLTLPDIDFFQFIVGFKTDRHEEIENNLIGYFQLLIKHDFIMNDDFNPNLDKQFLSGVKENFKNGYLSGFINKHSTQKNEWKLIFDNEDKRELFLIKFDSRINNYFDYAYGLLLYTLKDTIYKFDPEKEDEILKRIAYRYEPMFFLQERILKLMTQSGYNLNKHKNDIIDFLILSSLDINNGFVFVTDENAKLYPYLKKADFSESVMLTEEYLNAIKFY